MKGVQGKPKGIQFAICVCEKQKDCNFRRVRMCLSLCVCVCSFAVPVLLHGTHAEAREVREEGHLCFGSRELHVVPIGFPFLLLYKTTCFEQLSGKASGGSAWLRGWGYRLVGKAGFTIPSQGWASQPRYYPLNKPPCSRVPSKSVPGLDRT